MGENSPLEWVVCNLATILNFDTLSLFGPASPKFKIVGAMNA